MSKRRKATGDMPPKYQFQFIFILALLIPLTSKNIAQEADQITDTIISFDQTVEDTITERSIFDFWRFVADQGDVVVITMQASDGLAPLVGIAGEGANILARSDTRNDGTRLPDAEINGDAKLEFKIPESREYAIVATRVGNQDGTTTGNYSLTLRLASRTTSTNPYVESNEVTFRCGDVILQTALTIDFFTAANIEAYRFSVYGLDDFAPYLRITAGLDGEIQHCSEDSQHMGGDAVRFPGESPFTLTSEAPPEQAAQFLVTAIAERVRAIIATPEGTSGRYMLVIDGMHIDEDNLGDLFEFSRGPLTVESDLWVYMVRNGPNRLDPIARWRLEETEEEISCDDVGRFDCAEIPAFVDRGVVMADGTTLLGDRFTAGAKLEPDILERQSVFFSSRIPRVEGDYALVVIGELPERDASE